jgi:superfamily II DNA or RNA helicase
MKIFVSNIYSVLKTSNKDLKKALAKKYRARAPGYEFTPAYKRGQWNGYKYFFNGTSGKFGTGLLTTITEDLEYLDIEYSIVDNRTKLEYSSSSVEGIDFRDYQETLAKQALKLKSCIIKAPTGAGKTIILASILNALKGKTGLVFFNKKQLLYQTYKFLTEHGIECGVAFGDGVDIKPLTLCTIQSIDKVIDSHLTSSEFIVFDEIHEFSKGKVASKVLKSFPNACVRIGMSATPPTEKFSKLSVCSFLGKQIEFVTADDLVKEGYLTLPSIEVLTLPDEELEKYKGMSYPEVYDSYIINNTLRNDFIAEICKNISSKKAKVLILTKNLEHAKLLQALIPNSYKLEGKDGLLQREEVLEKFVKEEGPSFIIGTIIFQTGVDIPELTHLINARGLKSEIATIQALGRTLRKHENKNQVYIYDFLDKAPYLEKHAISRVNAYKSLNFNVTTHAIKKR